MNIKINKKEYGILLEILEIVHWVLRAHKTDNAPETEEYLEFEQKIFSYAEDIGCEDLIEYDNETKQYFPTHAFEENSKGMDFVEDFENDTFWEELIERLVERDLIRQFGEEKLHAMRPETRWENEELLREKYALEFQDNGLKNISIEK